MDFDKSIAQRIDHTILRADLTKGDIHAHCQEAIKYRFKTVCIPPYFISYAKSLLNESQTGICTVVGFPFGYNGINSKMEEAKKALLQGSDEVDFVVNIAAVKNQDWKLIDSEFDSLTTIVRLRNGVIKAIIETCLLTDDEIETLCQKIVQYNVDFVKTSTGFSTSGADLRQVALIKSVVQNNAKIKASGGIKTRQQALDFIDAGADRLGTSSSIQIVTQQ